MLFNSKLEDMAIVFLVADLDRTERFYRDVLDVPLAREGEGAEAYLQAAVVGGAVTLVFFQGEASAGTTPQIVFGLDAGGIDDLAASLADRGVTLVTGVTEAPGGWALDFQDPDGHTLSFFQGGDKPRSL